MSRGGRGGRGGSSLRTFTLEQLNLTRDQIPAPTIQPPPLYPKPSTTCPQATVTQTDEYLIEMRKTIRNAFKASRNFLDHAEEKRKLEKYSDKYNADQTVVVNQPEWDLRLFPSELHPASAARSKVQKKNLSKKSREAEKTVEKILSTDISSELLLSEDIQEVEVDLRELEDESRSGVKREKGDSGEQKSDEENEDDADRDPDAALVPDEDSEGETDYTQTYFDNGEEYLDDPASDDNMDEGGTY